MKQTISDVHSDLAGPGHVGPSTSAGTEAEPQQAREDRSVARRGLLTRGGVVVAGAIGAGMAGAAVASPAGAATGDPVVQGQGNSVGTDVPTTEITATNNTAPTPTLTLTNPGSRVVATVTEATPSLRLTKSPVANPSSTGAGGDMVATSDGQLWFTHDFPAAGTVPAAKFPAIVHTDANATSYVPLVAPQRMLDTRTSSGRTNVLDGSGKFDSTGRLLAGKTIHINLTSLVTFGDGVTSNLTVTKPATGGYLTLWSGAVARPTASSINFAAGQTIANLTVSGLAEFSTTATDTIAIFASATTHVILDVAAFAVSDLGQVLAPFTAATTSARAQRARQALAKLRAQNR
jgi:hypothetical protein